MRALLVALLCLWAAPAQAAIAVVQHFSQSLGLNGGTTSPAVDMTGANLIVLTSSSFGSEGATPTDSSSNTYTGLTVRNQSGAISRIWYVVAPTVSSSMTFTQTGSGLAIAIGVLGVSGAHASPYDQESGAASAAVTTIQPGSLTPSQDNCLVVSGVSNVITQVPSASGMTTQGTASVGGTNMLNGIAYVIQTTAAAVNPTWSWGGGVSDTGATMAVFKAAAAGGGVTIRGPLTGVLP